MQSDDLKHRTKQFSINVFRLIESIHSKHSIDIIGKQIMLAASAIGANYRAACQARSKADFISKNYDR